MDLPEQLKDWTDFDIAEFYVGQRLGIFGDEYKPEYKAILWSNNPVGECLAQILTVLVEADFLEQNDEGQFRWDPTTTVLGNVHDEDVNQDKDNINAKEWMG